MSTYNIAPFTSMGGVVGEQPLIDLYNNERSPHTKWVEKLRLATDFITADNTLICIADSAFQDFVTNVTPLGLTQSFSDNEGIPSALLPEIGSRRKRAMVGSSQGGSIQISTMITLGDSPLKRLTKYGQTLGIDSSKKFWSEAEWTALVGMNHDLVRNPIGIVVIEAGPDGRNYSAAMYEQCLLQGESRSYQAGQHLVVTNFSLIFEQKVPLWSVAATNTIQSLTDGGVS